MNKELDNHLFNIDKTNALSDLKEFNNQESIPILPPIIEDRRNSAI